MMIEKPFHYLKPYLFGAILAVSACVGAQAQSIADDPDAPIATGEHWTTAQPNSKAAYLLGLINFLEIEQAVQGETPPADDASLVPVMIRGLKDMTIRQIGDALDNWYADHPDQISQPVLQVIWFAIAKPNS